MTRGSRFIGHPAPGWMVNYADLMTELVCFFIVLYAISASLNKNVQQAKKDVEEKMKEDKVATEVKVTKDGMSITIEEKGENVFFESGSAEMSPRMDEILGKLTPILKKLAKDGHDVSWKAIPITFPSTTNILHPTGISPPPARRASWNT